MSRRPPDLMQQDKVPRRIWSSRRSRGKPVRRVALSTQYASRSAGGSGPGVPGIPRPGSGGSGRGGDVGGVTRQRSCIAGWQTGDHDQGRRSATACVQPPGNGSGVQVVGERRAARGGSAGAAGLGTAARLAA